MIKEIHFWANVRGVLHTWGVYDLITRGKCFFKGHKYAFEMGNWKGGRYEDIHITCDRCNRKFLKITRTEIEPQENK